MKIHSSSDASTHVGRLCVWTADSDVNPDSFSNFVDFRNSLDLKCDDKKAHSFTFTPDEHSPSTLYFNVSGRDVTGMYHKGDISFPY